MVFYIMYKKEFQKAKNECKTKQKKMEKYEIEPVAELYH